MKIKTYGVPELTEWQGKLKVGSIEVNVLFAGGTASPSGAQPAYFVTKDPITQFVIENSNEFKNGFIILMMQSDMPGEHPRLAVPKVQESQSVPAADKRESNVTDDEAGEVQQGGNAPATENARNCIHVKVGSKTEAIEWLKDHYPEKGYNGFNLKGAAAFKSACQENGVVFEY